MSLLGGLGAKALCSLKAQMQEHNAIHAMLDALRFNLFRAQH